MKRICRREIDNLKPYQPGKPISEVKRQLELEDVIKLASNECPYPPFPEAVEAVKKFLPQLNRYPDTNCTLLKERLSHYLKVSPSQLVLGNGSNELVRLIANVVLNPKEEVVMATPSFIVYPTVVKIMGALPREIPLKDFRHDLIAMLKAVGKKTKAVFICNPNNPTGSIVTREEVEKFLEQISDDVVVVFDEAYYDYVENSDYVSGLEYFGAGKTIVVLRTFSKIYGLAGCRIGYGIAPKFLVSAINKVREPFNVNAVAQVAAASSLEGQEELKRRKKLNSENRRYLYGEFSRLGLKYVPTEANFILVDVGTSSREVMERLLREGVIVRSGDVFGYPTSLRVTIGSGEENKRFIQTLEKVLKVKG